MISTAIERAYQITVDREWDTVYWAIDLHGVCLKSNYENGAYSFEHNTVVPGLRAIAGRPESKIILWSSCHKHEQQPIIEYFALHGIAVDYFNENPEVDNTRTGDFTSKFYFNILLDDKAGFEPDIDWQVVIDTLAVMPPLVVL